MDDLFCIDCRRARASGKFGRVEEDARSETGKAVLLAPGEASAIPLECGVSDAVTWKRFDFRVDCSAQPEDGRYRWHRAGEATLRRNAFFWFPKNLKCRFDLGHCFVNCDGLPKDINRFEVGLPRDPDAPAPRLAGHTVKYIHDSGVEPYSERELEITRIDVDDDGKVHLDFNGYKGDAPERAYRVLRSTNLSTWTPLNSAAGEFEGDSATWSSSWEGEESGDSVFYRIEAVPTIP